MLEYLFKIPFCFTMFSYLLYMDVKFKRNTEVFIPYGDHTECLEWHCEEMGMYVRQVNLTIHGKRFRGIAREIHRM